MTSTPPSVPPTASPPASNPPRGRWSRLWRHACCDEADARRLLPADAQQRLADHVRLSEARHDAEIRVCVEASLPLAEVWRGVQARERALDAFAQLRVWDTERNNGVLIYLLLADHAIEIVADRGLRHAVAAADWQRIAQVLGEALSAAHPEEGLHQAIDAVSALLDEHFPPDPHWPVNNELPDRPVVR